jgi:catechol 2,3-dioxygenase-like lactoylglutathione lyase family enzyme
MLELKLVTYLSQDVARTTDFYRSALNAQVIEDALPEYVKLRVGGFAFCIDQGIASDQPRLLLEARPLVEELQRLDSLGVHHHEPLQGQEGRRWFSVLDPDGREIIFGESI